MINGHVADPSLSAAAAVIKALGGSVDAIVGIAPQTVSFRDELIEQCRSDLAHERKLLRQILIFACAIVAFLVIFVAADILLPGAGWIRY